MLIVILAFVIFRADSMGQAFDIICKMFGVGANGMGLNNVLLAHLTPYIIFAFVLGLLFVFPWVDRMITRIKDNEKYKRLYDLYYVLSGVGLLLCLVFCIITLASDAYNPFIYFRF